MKKIISIILSLLVGVSVFALEVDDTPFGKAITFTNATEDEFTAFMIVMNIEMKLRLIGSDYVAPKADNCPAIAKAIMQISRDNCVVFYKENKTNKYLTIVQRCDFEKNSPYLLVMYCIED